MRQSIYSILLILSLLLGIALQAQNFQKSSRYEEIFPLNEKMEVSISNKYGDVQVIHWDKDSIRIEVNVEVNSNKESKTDKLFHAIDINFKANFFYVNAETNLAGKNTVWNDISDKTKLLFNSSTTTRINYVIHMPNTSQLKIQNKYGHIYLGDYKGELDIDLSNGDFKAHYLSGKTKLKVSFGDLFINKIQWALLETSNAEVEIEECSYLETITKTTKLRVEEIDELQMNSAHDKYYIGQLNTVRGISRYTFFKIQDLNTSIDLNQKFGSLHFRNLHSALEKFYLTTYKSDIHLSLQFEQNYSLDFRSITPPVIQYPTGEYEKTETVIDQEIGLKSTLLTWGSKDSDQWIRLHIQAEEGNVFINVK